jgi:transcription initiation factor TFIIIB Brf1 subunit/transcription initiation factor TFIIB
MNNLENQSFPKRKKKKMFELDYNLSNLKQPSNHSFPKRDEPKLTEYKKIKNKDLHECDSIDIPFINNDNDNIDEKIQKNNEDEIKEDIYKDEKKENINLYKNCLHTDTINSNGMDICIDCGLEISILNMSEKEWRYYGDNDNINSSDPSRCQFRKNPEKGIKKELIKLGFPIDISNLADELYLTVTKGEIKRSNLRKGIMFACVFNAYKQKNNPQIPEELQKKFKIDRKNISKGLTYFHLNNSNKMNDTYISIEDFIPKIMEKFNIKQNHIDTVLSLSKVIKNSSSILIRSNPQSVSSSLVFYYLKKLNPDISISQFSRIVKLSEITILRLINEIENIIENENRILIS